MQRTFKGEFYTQPLPSRIPEPRRERNAYLDYRDTRLPQRAQLPATNAATGNEQSPPGNEQSTTA